MEQPSISGAVTNPTMVPVQEQTATQTFMGSGLPQLGVRPSNRWSMWWDNVSENLEDETGAALGSLYLRHKRRNYNGTKLTADEANKLYPGLPEPFTEAVDPVLAQFAYNEFKRRQSNQVWKSRGPETGLMFELSSGIAASIADPANMALNIATAGAFSAAKIPMKAGAIFAENVVQNIVTESLVRNRLASEQQPRSYADSAFNVGVGAAGGTAAHLVGKAISEGSITAFNKIKSHVDKTPPGKVRGTLLRMIKASEGGKRFNPAASLEGGRPGVIDPAPSGVDPDAGFREIAHPSERQFILPEHGDSGSPVLASDDYGGTVVIDNPTHARNLTAGDMDGPNGTVKTVDIPTDAKFISLNTLASDPLVSRVAKELGIDDLPESATLRDVLDYVKNSDPEGAAKARGLFEKEGFSGYTEVIDTPSGKSHAAHIFDTTKVSMSESRLVDPDKISRPNYGEIERLQAQQDSPENARYHTPAKEPRPDKYISPEGQALSPIELEGAQAKKELEELAKTIPDLAKELKDIESLGKYDDGMASVVNEIVSSMSIGDDVMKLRSALLEKGIAASEDDLDALTGLIESIKSSAMDDVDFHQKVSKFMETDIVDWPAKRKIERLMNARIVARFYKLAGQTEGGRKSAVDNFIDLLRGGGTRFGEGVNLNTHDMAGGLEQGWIQQMRQALGDNLRAAESGLLEREITQDMAHLESDGKVPSSGNKQSLAIAKAYHDIKEDMFAVKAGYSPFLEKIQNYFYRQTHDRELVRAAGMNKWVNDAYETFGRESFPNLSANQVFERLADIWESIVDGRYHSSIFDKEAGDYNLAFRLANKRSLIPDNWERFYEYNESYGKSNVHVTMLDMIRSASRDISVMSKFGTTPRANVQRMISLMSRNNDELSGEFSKATDKILDAMHVQTFAYNQPAEAMHARIITGAQKWTTLVSNGATYLRSMLDFASATSSVSDLDGTSYLGNFSEIFWKYAGRFAKGSKEANAFASEMGAFVESATRNLYLEVGSPSNGGALDKMLQFHSVISLADRGRAAMTAAMSEIVSGRLAKYAETPWGDLPKQTRNALARYGIDERSHALLKYGISEINGRKYLTPGKLRTELLKVVRSGALIDDAAPEFLEMVPKVVDKHSDSSYNKPGNPYYPNKDFAISPRTGPGSRNFGIDFDKTAAYSPESTAAVAAGVHRQFLQAGFSETEAGVAATLHSTFFDSIGKASKRDPKALYDAYNLKVIRERQLPGVAGSLMPYSKSRGKSLMSTRPGVLMDKTVIHESAHFFLEALTDVHRIEGLDPEFKNELDGFYKWLGVEDGNVSVASHERFANSFEAYLRTNKAPGTALEKFFATIRDWYRRAFEAVRRGFASIPVSLSNAERGPQYIEDFYKKLMGGSGASELHGHLSYSPETMDTATLYANLGHNEPIRLPNNLTDLIMKTGAIINDQVSMGTTSPGAKERSIMYGRQDINTWRGALWRAFWQFKSSALKSFDTMARSYYSNPEKPNGDLTKVMKFVSLSMGLYAIQHEAENLLGGKTPENPATPEYALKALASSGAITILGESLVNEVVDNSTVRGMSSDLHRGAIPAVTRTWDLLSTVFQAAKSAVHDETRFPGGDVGRQIVNNFPYQNIFYSKALLHYYFLNGLREELDGGFIRQLEKNVSKKHGLLDERQAYFMFNPSE